jgi:hypothetical protein
MTATLRFLPWMRRGLARAITDVAVDGVPATAGGMVTASVTVGGEVVARDLRLRGPGDVVGLSPAQIVRCDPADGTADFEPNYFPAVELLAPDLPWMFTPAAPGDDKLLPWLVLVVVADREGVTLGRGRLAIGAPADARVELPDLTDAWAWAHVQSATEISETRSAADAYAEEPEAFLARLVCPRRLDENTRYLACVVPAFEAGRRAGLGVEVDPADASLAWTDDTAELELPVYFSWSFMTGPSGDFEALVKRLVPRELDAGVHDLDIGSPGSDRLPSAPGTLVSFAGALVSPAVTRRPWGKDHRAAFQAAMRTLLDESLASSGTSDPRPYDPLRDDPIVAPPAYGALPAGAASIPEPLPLGALPQPRHRPVWLADVNLDPAARAAAGLGAKVVRRNQEPLMASAWSQAAALRDINRVLNWTRLAAEVGSELSASKIAPLDDGTLIQVSGAARARIPATAGRTVRGELARAAVPSGITSLAFRRAARRGGTVGRGLAAAELRATSAAIATSFTADLAQAMTYADYVRPYGLQIGDLSILHGLPGLPADASAPAPARASRGRAARTMSVPTTAGEIARDAIGIALPTTSTITPAGVAATLRAGLDPEATLAAKLRARITAPASAWGTAAVPAAMVAAPIFPEPMSELLRRIDPDLMLPGAGEIPDDTVGLVAVNGSFVEGFLLGANHELAREFLWREYPVVLTDTWLRTFWDATAGATPDIGAVATWTTGRLGTHQIGAAADGSLVVVLKGALLRRYPDTVVYAVEAQWNAEGTAREERPSGQRRDPMFGGSLGRGLTYLGFALTEAEALGDVDAEGDPVPNGDAGWFFVFEQPPTGTRFGLDVGLPVHANNTPRWWKNVSWAHQVDDFATLSTLTHARAAGRLDGARRRYDEGAYQETWGLQAAAMARITFQRPVRMLVHASAMLP